MANYTIENIRHIEKKWHAYWKKNQVYKTDIDSFKPKFYVLDMFPYPSGAGLHVGHPLGYIASDILARFKRIKGFNVLHPIGFDAFGLPAEQYAIEHGISPFISTEQNIQTFRKQLEKIGFSYDWSREIRTCDPGYYKWTQWIFIQLFDSWYNREKQKAERISELIKQFEIDGNTNHSFPNPAYKLPTGNVIFSHSEWKNYTHALQEEILMQYRLAYLAHTDVNWCEALGTVLANDEVINGMSYRGGHPVIKKKMLQWSLRITEYAERLLKGLEEVEYSESMKEIQRNWIGKSVGSEIQFRITKEPSENLFITVFTTRPDTIYGVDFLVLAPEHEMVKTLTDPAYTSHMEQYVDYVARRSEIDRMAEVKSLTGCFTGAYAIHPISKKKIPIWVSEYVLAGYGTGAIMGVPCGDQRDYLFAQHFRIPITNIIGQHYNGKEANSTYDAVLENSGFLNGIRMKEAIPLIMDKLEETGVGKRCIKYKMRDAGWSRQRYWGEPFPIVYDHGIPKAIEEDMLPLILPDSTDFTPESTGEGPLARLKNWIKIDENHRRESNTMPTHAGAAWYFLRYTDPHNNNVFANRKALDYWNQVDVYIGGSEHAVAHLLYARLWIKVLHDLDYLNFDEPFKKLINQGKIMGNSRFVYRIRGTHKFVSSGLREQYETDALHVDVRLVTGLELNQTEFKKWKPDFAHAEFILEDGKYFCGSAVEKMSKSYFNVINPDLIIEQYGADTLRMYEMFLGPLEQSKPWNTHGIDGVYKFLKKFWNLFHTSSGDWSISEESPTKEELKVLHKTIKKIEWDMDHFSFNTSVSEFMICTNTLTSLRCNKRAILEPLTIMLSPFVPHITEELWEKLGHTDTSISYTQYPQYKKEYVVEHSFNYPISVNGRVRTRMNFPLNVAPDDMEKDILNSEIIRKWTEGKTPKKVIVVPGKIVNVVL